VSDRQATKPATTAFNKNKNKRQKVESDVTSMLCGTANSIQNLVSAVTSRKADSDRNDSKEPENDDWLFCKRLYNKLRNLPEGAPKEYYKLTAETEILKLTFGGPAFQCAPQPTPPMARNFQAQYMMPQPGYPVQRASMQMTSSADIQGQFMPASSTRSPMEPNESMLQDRRTNYESDRYENEEDNVYWNM
jgi:hypothetical protein